MNKASYPLPSRPARVSRFLRLLPLAALLAASIAPQAWADSGGSTSVKSGWYIGYSSSNTTGSNHTNVVINTNTRSYAAGGFSDTNGTGSQDKSGTAEKNRLVITYTNTSSGKVTNNAYGGTARGTNTKAANNQLFVAADVGGNAHGGHSHNGPATGNRVFLDGGTVGGNVYGGKTDTSGDATGNTVSLACGTVSGNVLGGECQPAGSCNDLTGNTLAVEEETPGTCLTVNSDIGSFDTLTFTLRDTIKNGDTLLSIGGAATLPADDTNISITIVGLPTLQVGNQITLLSAGALNIKNFTRKLSASGLNFEVDKVGNALIATVVAPVVPVIETHAIKGQPSSVEHGAISCRPKTVQRGTDVNISCNITPFDCYELASLSLPGGSCNLATESCSATNVTSDLTITARFVESNCCCSGGAGGAGGGAGGGGGAAGGGGAGGGSGISGSTSSSAPVMGDIGLLLSGIALAGAAVPALRRRGRKARKQG